ncbi:hypothetical protein ES708_10286 [subsurface metagenome]
MAKIAEMLGEKVISGFKGTLDFYYHEGQACVRAWPKSPGRERTPAVRAGWASFTYASQEWSRLSQTLRDAYNKMAGDSGLSGKDVFSRSYMKGLYRNPEP